MNQPTPKVLAVDDDPIVLKLIKASLTRSGFVVETASTGVEAISSLQNDPADVIASDLRMPGMSGLELIEALRADGNQTPVVMITSAADRTIALKALQIGAFDIMTKPFQASVITRLMSEARDTHLRFQALRALPAEHGSEGLHRSICWALACVVPAALAKGHDVDQKSRDVLGIREPAAQALAALSLTMRRSKQAIDGLANYAGRAFDLGNLLRHWHATKCVAAEAGLNQLATLAATIVAMVAGLRLSPETVSNESIQGLSELHEQVSRQIGTWQLPGDANDLAAIEATIKSLEKRIQKSESRAS